MGTELHLEMAPDKALSWAFTLFWSSLVSVTCSEEANQCLAIKTYFGNILVRWRLTYYCGTGNKTSECKNQACGYLALIVFCSSICSLKGTENYICMQSLISGSNQTWIGSWICFPSSPEGFFVSGEEAKIFKNLSKSGLLTETKLLIRMTSMNENLHKHICMHFQLRE